MMMLGGGRGERLRLFKILCIEKDLFFFLVLTRVGKARP